MFTHKQKVNFLSEVIRLIVAKLMHFINEVYIHMIHTPYTYGRNKKVLERKYKL